MNKKSVYKALPFVAILGALTSCSSIEADYEHLTSYRENVKIKKEQNSEKKVMKLFYKRMNGYDYFEEYKKSQALLKEIELELAQVEKKRKKRENILIAAAGATIGLSVLGTAVLFGNQGREG